MTPAFLPLGLGVLTLTLLGGAPPVAPTPGRAPRPKATAASSTSPPSSARSGIRARHAPLAPGDRISLDLKDADIRDVIRTFGELARINVVIDPDVKGSVTVSLHDVRWEDALDVILRSNGLGAVSEGRLTRVGDPSRLAGDETR
jgi:type IV pilus assembly protein PilQ